MLRAVRVLAAGLAALPAAGCAAAIFSVESFRSQAAFTDRGLAEYARRAADGPLDKAGVLATLGPPTHVIGQEDGEIFVYRRVALDTSTINLNPATVSAFGPMPPIPVYVGSDTSGRDDTLMVFFDAEGRVRGESDHLGIGDTTGSPAALIGHGVQEMLE